MVLAALACQPGDLDLEKELEEDAHVPAREQTGEEAQLGGIAGETIARMKEDAHPQVTVYDPAPDLSRWDLGVVYIPSGPPASPVTPDTANGAPTPATTGGAATWTVPVAPDTAESAVP